MRGTQGQSWPGGGQAPGEWEYIFGNQDFSRIFLVEDQPLLAPLQLPLVGDAEVA